MCSVLTCPPVGEPFGLLEQGGQHVVHVLLVGVEPGLAGIGSQGLPAGLAGELLIGAVVGEQCLY